MKLLDKFLEKNFRAKITFLFLLSCGIYMLITSTTLRVSVDNLIQLGASVSFLEGNGFCTHTAEEIGDIVSTPLQSFPFFYRAFAIPFLLATGKDVVLASNLMNVFSFAILLISLFAFIGQMDIEHKKRILFLITVFSFVVYSPLRYFGTTDNLTLSVCIFSLIALYNYITKDSSIRNLLVFILLLSMLPVMRYAYTPQTIAFILLFISMFWLTKLHNKKYHLIAVILPLITIGINMGTSYFQDKAGKYMDLSAKQNVLNLTDSFFNMMYAPFFNSFFPDFIILTFFQKIPNLYANLVFILLGIFMFFSGVIFIYLLFRFFDRKIKDIQIYFQKDKLHETLLMFLIIINLGFYMYLYRKSFFKVEYIDSGRFLYGSLAVVNRYLAPLHISTFLLAIIYTVKKKSLFFKTILFLSIIFSTMHFFYLRTVYHPFNTEKNMDLMNLPMGSYKDLRAIEKEIVNSKKEGIVYFIDAVEKSEDNYRQLLPRFFAYANGVVVLDNPILTEKEKNIIVLKAVESHSEQAPNEKWETVYEGKIYSLLKHQ